MYVAPPPSRAVLCRTLSRLVLLDELLVRAMSKTTHLSTKVARGDGLISSGYSLTSDCAQGTSSGILLQADQTLLL
jgi:hypothetical protein